MTFKLHNTLTRKKEVFKPIDPENVRMYVCGPTVYDYAHIGNARPVVVFDMLFRLLRHLYGEDHVSYARNITDIDDKIMKAAVDGNKSIKEISDHFAKIYSEDAASLNALEPTTTPRATEYLPQMKAMIEKLIADGHAYEAEGHVLFNVPSMATYGRLSNKDQDELIAGARVEVAPYKKDPRDFVLWKPSSDDQPGWDSPWGRGRPGWHLECSCMTEDLAETIDIHGGGLDLIFPHHENEIAQSECAHGKPMANYWVHNGYLVLGGEKMSKSLGNIKTIHGLLENHRGEALRLTLLSAHYRQPLDFSEDAVKEQKRRLDTWYRAIFPKKNNDKVPMGNIHKGILEVLSDDLNTPKALAILDGERNPSDLLAGANFLGLLTKNYDEWFRSPRDPVTHKVGIHAKAKAEVKVGVLKKVISAVGEIKGKSTVEGVGQAVLLNPEAFFKNFDNYLENLDDLGIDQLVNFRNEFKKKKDFKNADRIRNGLKGKKVILEDGAGGTTWRRED